MLLSRRVRILRREARRWAGARAGISLIEIIVVMAVMAVVLAIGLPSLTALFDLQQRAAARELAMTYSFLLNEASMRNVTFRIAYHLDEGYYQIEVGDPDTLVFSDPESRAAYEEEQEKEMSRFSDKTPAEGEEPEESDALKRFAGLTAPGFQTKVQLPNNTLYGFVYTPQYGEPMTPSEEPIESPEDARVAYSYVFSNGMAEHTVVRFVDADDPEDGYTVEVEPMSGKVSVESELTDIGASMSWLPTEAPEIQ